MKKKDIYKETQVFYYDNMIVRVHFPDITPEENERRMERINQAAAELLKEVYKTNNDKSHKTN